MTEREKKIINSSLYDFMKEYADKGEIALVRGNSRMSYGDFFKRVDKAAAGFWKLGVRAADVVMIALPNIFECVIAVYALSRIGAVASMVHPKLSVREFADAAEIQKPKAVLLSDINFAAYGKAIKGVKKVFCSYVTGGFLGLPKGRGFVPYKANGSEPAVYMMSGGTTGKSQTAVLSCAACNALVVNLFESIPYKFGDSDAMLAALPLFHGFGLMVGVHATLSKSMPIVLLPVFKAEKAVKAIAKNKVTTTIFIPRMLKKLLSCKKFTGGAAASLKNVYVGGDVLDKGLELAFNGRIKESGGEGRIFQGYGLTETGGVVALSADGTGGLGSVGKALCNMEHKLCTDDGLPAGEGELWLSGNQLFSGYLNGEAALVKDNDGKVWLKTGDIFFEKEGNLCFKERKKRLIKISGINVFPSEIEKAVKETGLVEECAAVEFLKDGKTFIRLYAEGELSGKQREKIFAHLSKSLSHWCVPVEIVCIEELPRTKIGKIDFMSLKGR